MFVPGCTRLARLNARLNVAHLLHPKGTLGKAQATSSLFFRTSLPKKLLNLEHLLPGSAQDQRIEQANPRGT